MKYIFVKIIIYRYYYLITKCHPPSSQPSVHSFIHSFIHSFWLKHSNHCNESVRQRPLLETIKYNTCVRLLMLCARRQLLATTVYRRRGCVKSVCDDFHLLLLLCRVCVSAKVLAVWRMTIVFVWWVVASGDMSAQFIFVSSNVGRAHSACHFISLTR